MKQFAFLALLVGTPALAAEPGSAPPAEAARAAVGSLIAADRAFADAAKDKTIVDALAPMFDSETVMPAPGGFVTGRDAIVAALNSNPLNAGAKATWSPVRGGISADGAHGFTIGFMTISAEGKPDRNAKYVAYWVRKPEGWRVAVYKRVPRPDGAVSLDLMEPSLPEADVPPATDAATIAAYRASLDKAERTFSDEAQRIGLGPAFVHNGRPDATNIGSGPGFTVGNEKIGADVGAGGPSLTWAPDGGVIVAATGDLGITWGLIRPNKPAAGQPAGFPYTTIWRRASPQGSWRYVAE